MRWRLSGTICDVGDEDKPRLPARRSIRLKDFDYGSSAGYVVTICSHRRKQIFGVIRDDQVELSPLGRVLEEEWLRSAEIRTSILLNQFIVMPNHFHGIVIVTADTDRGRGAVGESGPSRTLAALVRGFKSACAARVKKEPLGVELPVWQRGYYDRVIRDDAELDKFARYIVSNPEQWELDRHYRR
jgi:REP element-mobilizing transposase RayT